MRSIKNIYILLFLLCIPGAVISETLTVRGLEHALELALEKNADLKAQQLRLKGATALISQANTLPNPQLNLETENFSGSNSGFDQSENTFSLSQKIELGGKRSARTAVAKSQAELEEVKTSFKLANLVRDVKIAYSNVVLAQTLLNLAEEQKEFTEDALKIIKEKVKHGGILAGEQTKAEIALQLVSIDRQKANNYLRQAKRNLSSFWNGTEKDVGILSEGKGINVQRIEINEAETFLALKAKSLRINLSKSLLEQEHSNVIPDVTFSGGYRRFEESDGDAFVAGISVPLPLFNRNQGKVSQAQNELKANKSDYQQYTTLLKNEVDTLLQTRDVLLTERASIDKHLLPDSKKALTQIQEAYELGRVGYLDLIDSRKAYFDARIRDAQNLFALHSNEARIKTITGQILDQFKGN